MVYFKTIFLDAALTFIKELNPKISQKLLDKIQEAEGSNNPKIFKKLRDHIWEFRLRYGFTQIRLLAFWDKSDNENILVVATHGFMKKTDKVPGNEFIRAKNIREKYFESKNKMHGKNSHESLYP